MGLIKFRSFQFHNPSFSFLPYLLHGSCYVPRLVIPPINFNILPAGLTHRKSRPAMLQAVGMSRTDSSGETSSDSSEDEKKGGIDRIRQAEDVESAR